jgi:LEA14-like dessication related protein
MVKNSRFNPSVGICLVFVFLSLWMGSCAPKEKIVLRNVRDIVVDATTEPMLKANAILFNPNDVRIKLRSAKIDVYVSGKKSGHIDQEFKMMIPSKSEFTLPLEVKLNMKELGLFDTLFGMIGGKKLKVEYKGSIKVNYKGIPVRIPVNYESEVRLRF